MADAAERVILTRLGNIYIFFKCTLLFFLECTLLLFFKCTLLFIFLRRGPGPGPAKSGEGRPGPTRGQSRFNDQCVKV